jgi:hypothetical protein
MPTTQTVNCDAGEKIWWMADGDGPPRSARNQGQDNSTFV